MGKTFVRGKEKYSLGEKKKLGELVEKYKKEYDKEVKTLQGKVIMIISEKTRPNKTQIRVSCNALKFAKRCHEKYLNDEFVHLIIC